MGTDAVIKRPFRRWGPEFCFLGVVCRRGQRPEARAQGKRGRRQPEAKASEARGQRPGHGPQASEARAQRPEAQGRLTGHNCDCRIRKENLVTRAAGGARRPREVPGGGVKQISRIAQHYAITV